MKKFSLIIISSICILSFSCNNILHETVRGNGNATSEQRSISSASDIKSYGSFDIDVIQGSAVSVKVEADQNLLPYIITENKNGSLIIRSKDNVNLSSTNKITVYITTNKLESINLNGSGNVKGQGTFMGSDHVDVSIAGTGDITLALNTPSVSSSIAGTGNINLSGETKDSKITIAGVGDYKAEDLKAENANVHIAGSGSARLFASTNLNIDIAGSGDVYYRGAPQITQHVAGSGAIKQLP